MKKIQCKTDGSAFLFDKGRAIDYNSKDTFCNRIADMAELADAPDLGSGGRPCRFKSCYPHFMPLTCFVRGFFYKIVKKV